MLMRLFFSKARWAMKILPGLRRGSGEFVVFVVVVVEVEGRVMMALDVDLAVFEVVLEARESGR